MAKSKYEKIEMATVFSGIGAPEYALSHLVGPDKVHVVFGCDCGETSSPLPQKEEERLLSIKDAGQLQQAVKDAYAPLRKRHFVKEVYFANYKNLGAQESNWFDDIRFLSGKNYRGKVDLLVGGSPCQSFSNMGKRKGLEDARGTLFYHFARLVKEMQPKVFVYENVRGMLTHNHGDTWMRIQKVFESLGYHFSTALLNSKDYGIPQDRTRLFVVGFRSNAYFRKFRFPEKKLNPSLDSSYYRMQNSLIDPSFYLKKKGFEFVTSQPGRARINRVIIGTEKRNQQFNWNGDFIFVPYEEIKNTEIEKTAHLGVYQNQVGCIRKLTPRECHRLMGFGDDFLISDNNVQAYKEAGNSMVVNVLTALFESILETGVFAC